MKKTLFLVLIILLSASTAWGGYCREGNCLNGTGVYQWADGSSFSGRFADGVPDGEGVFISKDKQRFMVVYKKGQPVTSTPYSEEDEALKERQREAQKFNLAGSEYFKKGDYKSAIFFFNKAITKWPNNKEFHENYRKAKEKIQ
ncbi:MAG: hypothetical protein KKG47_15435 [Proteobacteria bacterium]|nr:hypothetical protein [Pseudomonadota bacterium]MBU1737977.1 hypothetical protein [Pseudomonadota bacterium]